MKTRLRTQKKMITVFYSLCLMLFCSNIMQAQTTYTWVDGNTGNWSDATNWTKSGTVTTNTTPGGPTGAGEIVVINSGACNVDVSPTIRRLTVGSTASAQGILNINLSQTLTITSPNLSPLTLAGGKINNSGSLSAGVSVTAAGVAAITVSAPANTTPGLDWGYSGAGTLSLRSATSSSVAAQQGTAVLVNVGTNLAGETPVFVFNTAPTITLANAVYAFVVATDGKLKIGGTFTINTPSISPLFLNFAGAGTVDILTGAAISVASNNTTTAAIHVIQFNGGTLNNSGSISLTGSSTSSMRLQGNAPVTCAFNNFGTYTSSSSGIGFLSNSGTPSSVTIDNKSTGTVNITNLGQPFRLQMAATKYVMINSGTMNLTGGGNIATNANSEIFSQVAPNESSITNTGTITSNKGFGQFNPNVAFTALGSTVTLLANPLVNDSPISFSAITTTAGIVINTTYYVVNVAGNTFQVAATPGGAPITLSANGVGNLFSSVFKPSINNSGTITFTPNTYTTETPVFSASVNFTNTGTVNTNASTTNNAALLSANTFTSGTLSPGGDVNRSIMKISGASIALGTTTIRMNVSGATAGTGHDQITAVTTDGGFDLTGATLDVTGISGTSSPLDIVVANGAGTIIGTFATVVGLPGAWFVDYSVVGKVRLVYTLPNITSSQTALIGFAATDSSASAAQSFVVAGTYLTSDVAIDFSPASTDYEFSIDNFVTSGVSSLILAPAAGTLANTTVYVRLKSSPTAAALNATVAITSASATTRSVALSGNVTLSTIDRAVSGFSLYPNPSNSNSFNVVIPQSMSRASLTVSNLLGQKLYSQDDLQSGATEKITVDNVNTAGVYLVRLTSEGKTATTKWIVQ